MGRWADTGGDEVGFEKLLVDFSGDWWDLEREGEKGLYIERDASVLHWLDRFHGGKDT